MSAAKLAHKKTVAKSAAVKNPGKPLDVSLDELQFDERNPRLPEELADRSQDNLLVYITTEYHPLEIAKSISAHGYFPSEPLIVIKSDSKYVSVEGNRRLAALKLLSSPALAATLNLPDADEWAEAAEGAQLPEKIPCILASSRDQVAPIIGYRHISGIEPWDPWAKARFLATLIDDSKLSFEKAASGCRSRAA